LITPSDPNEVVKNLIQVTGQKSYDDYCGHFHLFARHTSKENGEKTKFSCLEPWMEKALNIRQEMIKLGQPGTQEGKVRYTNFLVKKLEKALELDTLMKWIGTDNFIYYVSVDGFRTKDENGDTEYVSDTVGTRDPDV